MPGSGEAELEAVAVGAGAVGAAVVAADEAVAGVAGEAAAGMQSDIVPRPARTSCTGYLQTLRPFAAGDAEGASGQLGHHGWGLDKSTASRRPCLLPPSTQKEAEEWMIFCMTGRVDQLRPPVAGTGAWGRKRQQQRRNRMRKTNCPLMHEKIWGFGGGGGGD